MLNKNQSEWEISGSSGHSVSLETPLVNIGVNGSFARFPLENKTKNTSAKIEGYGSGVNVGGSVDIPFVGASFSLEEFPADGIGKIYKGKVAPSRPFVDSDFTGSAVVLYANAGSHTSGGLGAVVWLNTPAEQCEILAGNCSAEERLKALVSAVFLIAKYNAMPFGTARLVQDVANKTKAVGFFTGVEFSTAVLHAGISATYYRSMRLVG